MTNFISNLIQISFSFILLLVNDTLVIPFTLICFAMLLNFIILKLLIYIGYINVDKLKKDP